MEICYNHVLIYGKFEIIKNNFKERRSKCKPACALDTQDFLKCSCLYRDFSLVMDIWFKVMEKSWKSPGKVLEIHWSTCVITLNLALDAPSEHEVNVSLVGVFTVGRGYALKEILSVRPKVMWLLLPVLDPHRQRWISFWRTRAVRVLLPSWFPQCSVLLYIMSHVNMMILMEMRPFEKGRCSQSVWGSGGCIEDDGRFTPWARGGGD